MRIAVTGATGNVGTAVIRALRAEPEVTEIVGLARRLPTERPGDDTMAFVDGTSVRHVAVDVLADDLRPHLAGCDVVIHLAWLIQPSHRPVETWKTNVIGSRRVFAAAIEAGASTILHCSSIGAYSAGPDDGHAVDETWPTDSLPTANYGREKAYVERLLDLVERDHPEIRVVRLRPAFIFQRSAATEQRRLFLGPFVPNTLMERGRLPVLPVPTGLRFQVVHADDVGQAFRLAALHDVRGAFNIAADPPLDADDLGELLDARALDVPRRLVRGLAAAAWHLRLSPTEPSLLDLFLQLPLIDTARAQRELGWSPTRTAHAAIGEMFSGIADGAGGDTPPLAGDRIGRRVGEVLRGVGSRQ